MISIEIIQIMTVAASNVNLVSGVYVQCVNVTGSMKLHNTN